MKEDIIKQNREMLKLFINNRPIAKDYQIDRNRFGLPFGYIYCIENLKNHKKYIGSTYSNWTGVPETNTIVQLRKRASDYLYEYNMIMKNKNLTTASRFNRPIIQAMVAEGFNNFIMYPMAETTKFDHNEKEKYFINFFDTIKNGYNIVRGGASNNRIGTKLMAKDKLLRSEGVICIHVNNKKILFSDSMKLFGDYMNSSKDMIKNSVRKGRPYKGWFIFYINPDKRAYILNKNVLGDGLPVGDRHSDKSKQFYQELYTTVNLYLMDNAKSDQFPGFELLPPLEYKDEK